MIGPVSMLKLENGGSANGGLVLASYKATWDKKGDRLGIGQLSSSLKAVKAFLHITWLLIYN